MSRASRIQGPVDLARGPHDRYIPAAGRSGLSALYDPVMALTMRERAWRPRLVAAATAQAPTTILDIGCGTGTLAVALAAAAPDARVVAVDGDAGILAVAHGKAARARVRLELVEGLAQELPFPEASADVAVLSLVLHHLMPQPKRAALDEARRVLRPGGRLLIADWGRPRDPLAVTGFALLRLLDGRAQTADHARGRVPALVRAAGFTLVETTASWTTLWGRLELLHARR